MDTNKSPEDLSLAATSGGATVGVTSSAPWNPMTSPDWEGEKHTREAIHRIKG